MWFTTFIYLDYLTNKNSVNKSKLTGGMIYCFEFGYSFALIKNFNLLSNHIIIKEKKRQVGEQMFFVQMEWKGLKERVIMGNGCGEVGICHLLFFFFLF